MTTDVFELRHLEYRNPGDRECISLRRDEDHPFHILGDEDAGMMQTVEVVDGGGASGGHCGHGG